MKDIEKILHPQETVLVSADISKSFYLHLLPLYLLAFLLLLIAYELEIGVIGLVLLLRTAYVHFFEIKEKASFHCVLTQERLIIHKGHKIREIFPIRLEEIRSIYIKPTSKVFQIFMDVGTLEVVTNSGGRYVIRHIKEPYTYHRAIIGDVVSATNYAKQKAKKDFNTK